MKRLSEICFNVAQFYDMESFLLAKIVIYHLYANFLFTSNSENIEDIEKISYIVTIFEKYVRELKDFEFAFGIAKFKEMSVLN